MPVFFMGGLTRGCQQPKAKENYRMKHSSWKGGLGAVITVGLLASPIAALPAYAAPNGVVINEAYVNGGSANAPYLNKFVELHNTTSEPI